MSTTDKDFTSELSELTEKDERQENGVQEQTATIKSEDEIDDKEHILLPTTGMKKIKDEDKEKENTTSHSGKLSGKVKAQADQKKVVESESGELLGSVTTQNCPGVRTSARVIQKMKQDAIRPSTPPLSERDTRIKDEKPVQKTPSQTKPTKVIWSNIEKSFFFDALNEYGKDFETIANYVNTKLKRKSATDLSFKSKEQIRTFYYQTFHKISKYIKFSEEVKKPAQELYALINYGEMRRKLQFVSEKNCMKIRDLVYKGQVAIRCKGKNIRIRTPSCKALRKLNLVEDWLEDIKLPVKVEVCLRPASMDAFGRVQSVAQNPLIRTVVPLQKKLVNIIKTFQHKWRSQETKLVEEAAKLKPSVSTPSPVVPTTSSKQPTTEVVDPLQYQEPMLCLAPNRDAVIHRPVVSITEFLSSFNICLNSYEERMGVKIRGETLCQDRISNKRQRSDSGSEKKSPDPKKYKAELGLIGENGTRPPPSDLSEVSNSDDNLNEELQELLTDNFCMLESSKQKDEILSNNNEIFSSDEAPTASTAPTTEGKSRKKQKKDQKKADVQTFRPLVSDQVIRRIRKGWTISNAGDITVGDLYCVFGQDSKLMFEYHWNNADVGNSLLTQQKTPGMPYSASDCDDVSFLKSLESSSLGNKLKHLLLIANLSERVRKKQCSCGHMCDKTVRSRLGNELTSQSFVSNKSFPSTTNEAGVFRQPNVPNRRPGLNMDTFNKYMPNGFRSKQPRMRAGVLGSRQVVVQRLLPCQPMANHSNHDTDIMTANNRQSVIVATVEADKRQTEEQGNDDQHNSKTETEDDDESDAADENGDSEENEENLQDLTKVEMNNKDANANCNSINSASTSLDVGDEISCSSVDISSLMELSLPSPMAVTSLDENTADSAFNILPSLRDSVESPWNVDNLNDISMSSILGHLEDINSNGDISISTQSDISIDFMTKFADITASMQAERKDL